MLNQSYGRVLIFVLLDTSRIIFKSLKDGDINFWNIYTFIIIGQKNGKHFMTPYKKSF